MQRDKIEVCTHIRFIVTQDRANRLHNYVDGVLSFYEQRKVQIFNSFSLYFRT